MNKINFSTAPVKQKQKLDTWRDILCQSFGPLNVNRNSDEHFFGSFSTSKRAQLQFNELRYAGQKLERTSANLSHFDQEYFSLGRPTSGSIYVKQEGREFTIEPGSLILLNQCCPYTAEATEEHFQVTNISIPYSLLAKRAPSIGPYYRLPINDGSHRGQLLSAFKKYFENGINHWSENEAMILREQFLDLIVLLMVNRDDGYDSAEEPGIKAAHRERVMAYIKYNHRNPNLHPKIIAEECGISVSYLHKVFHDANLQIEDYIYSRRLDTCRNVLLDSLHKEKSMRQIAQEAGFNHQSHFSRLFKEKFGMSPLDYRNSHFESD